MVMFEKKKTAAISSFKVSTFSTSSCENGHKYCGWFTEGDSHSEEARSVTLQPAECALNHTFLDSFVTIVASIDSL